MNGLKVEKRDGQLEDFAFTKVVGSVLMAGATPEQAKDIAKQVAVWAGTAAVEGKVKTTDIRTKVLELLKPVNQEAANAYESYVKPA
jgi:hypothetical protein